MSRGDLIDTLADSQPPTMNGGHRASRCYVVDTDFGFLQDFSKSLRGLGVETVELLSSARLAENVDDKNPDLIFIDLNPSNPHDCVRALFSLKECKFAGRVQLLGRCESPLLENYRKIGSDLSLTMLPALQKPIDFSAVRKIVLGQRLGHQPASTAEFTLKTAIADECVTFWYQPKVDLRKRQVVGAEAFARIVHPHHGILLPAEFLAGAGEDELTELAGQALVSALKMSAMLDELGICLKIALNLSVESLVKLPIADVVLRHRPRNEQWPGLVFDVMESQVLNKIIILREKFHELEQYGISLAIDNFGRGNSSFSAFRYLPFAEIKMDLSFVQGCASNHGNANVCKSMVQIAHNFARSAVAVGIETDEDAHELERMGCDVGQGYLFGRPMTEQQLITMMMTGRTHSRSFCNVFTQGASSQHA